MAWDRPTLTSLHERIARDFSGRLLDGATLLRRSVLAVLAKVWAGACHTLHSVLAWLYLQVFVDTAEGEYMERWAGVWNLSRLPAAAAAGDVVFAGQDGAVIPAGTLLQHQASGLQYALEGRAVIADGSALVRVIAVETGAAGNLDAGEQLQLLSPIAGVESVAVVQTGGLTGGADAESDDALRARVLERLRQPPRGGSMADYVRWAREVPGVTRAWCYPMHMGIGTVGVCFVCDAQEDPFPSEEMVQRVQEHIEPLRPATVKELAVFAPEPLDVTVRLRISPDTEALRDAVRAEIEDVFSREGAPDSVLYRSHIAEAVSLTPGEQDHELLEPAEDVVVPAAYLPQLTQVVFEGEVESHA